MNKIRNRNKKKNNLIFSKLGEKIKQSLPYLFLFLLPTQLGKHFFFSFSYINGVRVDYLAPTLYLTDIIFFLIVIFNLPLLFSFLKQKKILFIFFILFFNLLFSQSKLITLYSIAKIFQFFFIAYFFYKIKTNAFLILFSFFLITSVEFFLALYQAKFGRSLEGVFYFFGERHLSLSIPGIAKVSFFDKELLRPYATFSHPNSLAGFYLLLYTFILTQKKFNRFLFLKNILLFFSTLLVLLSFSKTAIVCFLLVNLIFYFKNGGGCRLCFLAKSVTFSVLAFLFIFAKGDVLSLLKRKELVLNSLKIIGEHPLFGIGLGNYLLAQKNFNSFYPLFFNQPVHNIFLLLIAEIGLVSFFILFLLLIFFLKKNYYYKKGAVFFLLLTVCFTGLFDHYWLTLKQNFLILAFVWGESLKRS